MAASLPPAQGLELATAAPSLWLCSVVRSSSGPPSDTGLSAQLLRGFGPRGTCVNFLGPLLLLLLQK